MFRPWPARSGYVSLLRSEEDSFGGQFYKYYVPTGLKIGRGQIIWGSVNLDGYSYQHGENDHHKEHRATSRSRAPD